VESEDEQLVEVIASVVEVDRTAVVERVTLQLASEVGNEPWDAREDLAVLVLVERWTG